MANEITEEVEKVEEAKEIKIDLKVDKKKAEEAMKTLKDAFSGVSKTVDKISGGIKKAMGSVTKEVKSYLGDIGDAMTDAFTVTSMEEYAAASERFGEGLAGSLLSMNENMAALETSIGRQGRFLCLGIPRHGNVCCLRGGNGYARCFGDPLAGVLWMEVSGRCGFAFGARRQGCTGRRKTIGWKEILAMERS